MTTTATSTDLNTALAEVIKVIRNHQRFFLGTHMNPDGDGLGAIVACKLLLEQMGKTVTAVIADPLPSYYRFMQGQGAPHIQENGSYAAAPDEATFIFDCGDRERVHPSLKVFEHGGPVVNVDHHASNNHFGSINYIDISRASTGLMILDIADALEQPISPAMAEAIYTTLITDTGCFRHSNTTAEALAAATRLVAAGAVPHLVVNEVYKSRLFSHLQLKAFALERASLSCHDKVITSSVPYKDFSAISGKGEDFEGIVEELLGVAGVEVAVLLNSPQEGVVKISLRSKGPVNVCAVAQKMGGGGHVAASGAKILGKSMAEVERVLSAHIEEAVQSVFGQGN